MVKKYSKDDPFEMKVMELPGGDIKQQACVMAEEFRDMGATEKDLMNMFSNPYYGGLHLVYVQLGEKKIKEIIRQVYENISVVNKQENVNEKSL